MSALATLTPATVVPVATLAPLAAPDTYSVAALHSCMLAYDTTKAGHGVAGEALAVVVLARYAFHAANYARSLDGVAVLPDGDRKEVARRIWLDAIGRTEAPAAADRSAAETTLGQYVSRYGTVAVNGDFGLDALIDVPTAKDAYTAISESKGDAAKRAAEIAFIAWLAGQSSAVQSAFKTVKASLATDGAKAHLTSALSDLRPVTASK